MKYLQILIAIILLFIVMYKISLKPENKEFSISKDSTSVLKGGAILLIMLHHFALNINDKGIFLPFMAVGYLGSTMFFFLSGYGLEFGRKKMSKKETLLKCFSRLWKVFLPAVVAVVSYEILLMFFGFRFSVSQLFLNLFNLRNIDTSMWFIYIIMAWYIIYYLVSYFISDTRKKEIFLIFCALTFIIFGAITGFEKFWFDSGLGFPFGIVYFNHKDRIGLFLSRLKCKFFLSIFFIISFTIGFISDDSLILIIRSIAAALFLLVVLTVLQIVKIEDNIILKFIGFISYDLYLIHGKVIRFLLALYSKIDITGFFIFFYFIICFCIFFSCDLV